MKTETTLTDPELARQFFADKMMFTTGPVELSHQIDANETLNIIDVRDAEDFKKGHIPGAKSLPQDQWSHESNLRRDIVNILYCYSPVCHLAASAAVQFAEKGYLVMEMDGCFEVWKEYDLPIEK